MNAIAQKGPEIDRAALIVVDMQNDFVHPEGAFAQRARVARDERRRGASTSANGAPPALTPPRRA